MLAKIQKALGEYLERERSSFPRFYFVGDEDLLEILGNSKDIVRIQKHLKKMFAGVMGIEFDEETRTISAIVSREGEKVALLIPINLNEVPKVNDWLRKLELAMQNTLAKLLDSAHSQFSKFNLKTLSPAECAKWLDCYPVRSFVLWCNKTPILGSNRLHVHKHLVEHCSGECLREGRDCS